MFIYEHVHPFACHQDREYEYDVSLFYVTGLCASRMRPG